MEIKVLPREDLYKADCLQQIILNPDKKRRYRSFSYVKKQYARNPNLFIGCYDKHSLVGVIFGYVKKSTVLLGEFAVDKDSSTWLSRLQKGMLT